MTDFYKAWYELPHTVHLYTYKAGEKHSITI